MSEAIESQSTSREVGVAGPTEYRGNTNDVIALTAAISGLTLCGYMSTNGLICCLPILMGAAGLLLAKDAQDPTRARNLSIIGIVAAGALLLLVFICVVAYVGVVLLASLTTGGAMNTPRLPVF